MTSNRPADARYRLQFDQFQRYASAALSIERLRSAGVMKVLEVGAHTHSNLRLFLPTDQLVFVDSVISGLHESPELYVCADGSKLPFDDRAFDFAIALDVIEHLPREERSAFIRELARVSREGFVLAAPFNFPTTIAAEENANSAWVALTGTDHPWLAEHEEFGLPNLKEVEDQAAGTGFKVVTESCGNCDIWIALMRLHLLSTAGCDPSGVSERLNEIYSRHLYRMDDVSPVYRHVIVATRHPERLASQAHSESRADTHGAIVSTLRLLSEVVESQAHASQQIRLSAYFRGENEASLSEVARVSTLVQLRKGVQPYRLAIPARGARTVEIRLDPSEGSCLLHLASLTVFSSSGQLIWEWNRAAGIFRERSDAMLLELPNSDGALLLCAGNDPWLRLPIEDAAFPNVPTDLELRLELGPPQGVKLQELSEFLKQFVLRLEATASSLQRTEIELASARAAVEKAEAMVRDTAQTLATSNSRNTHLVAQVQLMDRKVGELQGHNMLLQSQKSVWQQAHQSTISSTRLDESTPVAEPIADLQVVADQANTWRAISSDPQFLLHLTDRELAGKWIRFSFRLNYLGHLVTNPALYFDLGDGFSGSSSIVLPRPCSETHLVEYILCIPPVARAIRFDPLSQKGAFVLTDLRMKRLSRVGAAAGMLRAIGHRGILHSLRQAFGHAIREESSRNAWLNLRQALVALYRQDKAPACETYEDWIRAFEIPAASYGALAREQAEWSSAPLISVVMPVFNTPRGLLEEAIQSVRDQVYANWELCIANDASSNPDVGRLLDDYSKADPRIKVVHRTQRGHISAASNSALSIAQGSFVALLDHDDRLHPLALYFVAKAIRENPTARVIFTDEDKIVHRKSDTRYEPYFKCDFNYDLFLSQNMISHLGCYKRDLVIRLGGFREGFEGAQDYDLALRALDDSGRDSFLHIPRVLYHWRATEGSTALSGDEKPYATAAARRAVEDHLRRSGVSAVVMPAPEAPGMQRVRYRPLHPPPSVCIIIPTRDRADLLRLCVTSILSKTTYVNYSICIVDNGSREPETHSLLAELPKDRVTVLRDDRPFNFSAINNRAVAATSSDFVCLMNNDIEVVTPDWLEEMVSHAARPNAGAVGARLWYPDGRLQHGGVVLIGGVAGHSHKFLRRGERGYFFRGVLQQEFSAVTAAVMVVKRSAYDAVNGLDESLEVAFNDIDFCLRLRQRGLHNLWTPYAEFIHHESASRGHETTPEKQARFLSEVRFMQARWGHLLHADPAYSPNLTMEREDFSWAWPPRIESQ